MAVVLVPVARGAHSRRERLVLPVRGRHIRERIWPPLLVGVALATVVAGGLVLATARPAVPVSESDDRWAVLRVASYNVHYANPRVEADVRELSKHAGAIALQEVGGFGAALDNLRRSGYGVYPRGASDVVVWRKRSLRRVAAGRLVVGERTYVGPDGAGGDTFARRYVNWVRFLHKPSGRYVVVGSTHVVPSVYLPIRRELAAAHVERTAAWVARRSERTFVGGDWNMTEHHELFGPLEAVANYNHHVLGPLPTHSVPDPHRAIDGWWHRGPAFLIRHYTWEGASDHAASIVRYRIRRVR